MKRSRRSSEGIDPWAVAGWALGELVVFWILTVLAASRLGMFANLPYFVIGPLYIGACVVLMSIVAAVKGARSRVPLYPSPIVVAIILQGLFVATISYGVDLPGFISQLACVAALLAMPSVAVLHIVLAEDRTEA